MSRLSSSRSNDHSTAVLAAVGTTMVGVGITALLKIPGVRRSSAELLGRPEVRTAVSDGLAALGRTAVDQVLGKIHESAPPQ